MKGKKKSCNVCGGIMKSETLENIEHCPYCLIKYRVKEAQRLLMEGRTIQSYEILKYIGEEL
jgi:reverse gyrase